MCKWEFSFYCFVVLFESGVGNPEPRVTLSGGQSLKAHVDRATAVRCSDLEVSSEGCGVVTNYCFHSLDLP